MLEGLLIKNIKIDAMNMYCILDIQTYYYLFLSCVFIQIGYESVKYMIY